VRVTLDQFRGWLNGGAIRDLVWRCEYCRALMNLSDVSVDHKFPVAQRGPNEIWNWAICCRSCNECKGPISAEAFLRILGVLDRSSEKDRQSVLSRLRAGWRTARARGYQRRRRAA
jgi:hypothetical protein